MKKILIAPILLVVFISLAYFFIAKQSNLTNQVEIRTPIDIKIVENVLPPDIPKPKYGIPYKAEGNFENLYKNLKEINDNDKKLEIILFAKNIAKEAEYSIAGKDLDKYIISGKEYVIEFKVYENSEFYIVNLLPVGTPTTSNNLDIGIQKETNKIISILKGS
jgi:hypothetical protein